MFKLIIAIALALTLSTSYAKQDLEVSTSSLAQDLSNSVKQVSLLDAKMVELIVQLN